MRRLVALIGLLTLAFAGVFSYAPGAGAQIDPCIVPQGGDSGDASTLAFSQRVDDNKTSLPTETPDCEEDEPTPTWTPVREDDDPTRVPDCEDGPMLTPVDPTPTDESTVEPSPTDEPTVEPSPTDEPTIEPSPTDPIPGFINNTLAFAQTDPCDPGDDGGDGGGDDGVVELPKTGTGESSGLQTMIIFGAMAAGVVLLCAGFVSARRKA
jgi:hypothetical protein